MSSNILFLLPSNQDNVVTWTQPKSLYCTFVKWWLGSKLVPPWDSRSIRPEPWFLQWQLCTLHAYAPPQISPGNSTAVNQYAASFIKPLMNAIQPSIIFPAKHTCWSHLVNTLSSSVKQNKMLQMLCCYLLLSRSGSLPFRQEITPQGDILGLHSMSTSPPTFTSVWLLSWLWEKSGATAETRAAY